MFKHTWQCLLSPRLYHVYRDGVGNSPYEPEFLEKLGDTVITTVRTIFNISLYTSPFIATYIYRRGLYTIEENYKFLMFCGGLGCLLALSLCIRAIGRAKNSQYIDFLNTWKSTQNSNQSYLEAIRKYDFDFSAWPVTYSVTSRKRNHYQAQNPSVNNTVVPLPWYQETIVNVLAYIATHTFALRLIYPGSLGIIQYLLGSTLQQGRTQLIELHNGQRAKLGTVDGNFIDTMFVDNRRRSRKGKTLVICCEGNSGFYEIGIMTTPIKTQYSAIGWNHPGFAGSTGLPYPEQEQNAMDAVVQYAINELNFQPEDIVMFGWSIGGYAATWGAVNYPDIKALVLDATFDDLLPLAENQMPSSWSILVKKVITCYVNLNISELITQYPGPVKIIRRTEDEIICLRPGQLSTNRGNELLLRLIKARHPELSDDNIKAIRKYVHLVDVQRTVLERNSNSEISQPLKLINSYLHDYKSAHCMPLPEEYFDLILDSLNTNLKK